MSKTNKTECKDCVYWNIESRYINKWELGVCERCAPRPIPIVHIIQSYSSDPQQKGWEGTYIVQTKSTCFPGTMYNDGCYEGLYKEGLWKKRILFRKFKL